MRLSSISVKGFRSLQDVQAPFEPYTCLIGRNDAGKSSMLRAVQLLLDPHEKPVASDYCTLGDGSQTIMIEAEFVDCPAHIVFAAGGSTRLRRTVSGSSDQYEYKGLVPANDTLRAMMAGSLTKSQFNAATDINDDVRASSATFPDGKLSAAQWRVIYAQLDQNGLVEKQAGWAPVAREVVSSTFEVIFLTADMRVTEEATDSPKSLFGRLGGLLYREACRTHPEFLKKQEEFETLLQSFTERNEEGQWAFESIQKLEDVLQEELGRFDPDVKVKPTATAAKLPALNFPFTLDVEDHHVSGLQCMGHGLRRSMIFAMLRTLARMPEIAPPADASEMEAVPEKLKVFLIEEPELYLHPQAERMRMRDLRELGDKPMTQVVACTHSAIFVDMSRYRSILRLDRPGRSATVCHHWKGPDMQTDEKELLQAVRAMHPTSAAALFAELAILAEGETEVGCLPTLARRVGLATTGVEVVDCGGAPSVPTLARICDALGVRYTAWFDKDRPEAIEKVHIGASVGLMAMVVLDPDWEAVGGVPPGDRSKPWRSYKHFVLDEYEPPEALAAAIRAAYGHRNYDMRQHRGETT